MCQRQISAVEVLRILREGVIEDPPKWVPNRNEWQVKVVRRQSNGRFAGVVTVVVEDEALILITVEWEDRR
jgi:hypothetical protein